MALKIDMGHEMPKQISIKISKILTIDFSPL